MYLAKFDDQGNRITSIVDGVHFAVTEDGSMTPQTPEGFIPISDQEQALYVSGQYIRDPETRQPVQRPVNESTLIEKLAKIRDQRDQLLADSDKYMLMDYPIGEEQRGMWIVYRQQLRDIPETCDLDNPVWPVQPSTLL